MEDKRNQIEDNEEKEEEIEYENKVITEDGTLSAMGINIGKYK